ncbi:MAG: P-II family nitrogen regulator [Chloroflexota bacterium]
MKLVILITSQVEAGLDVAQAWQEAGAPGVTIIRSHGLHSLQRELRSGQVELPRMMISMGVAMAAILDNMEERGEIILSVVEDELVDALIAAANRVLGDLTEPDNGVLFVLPVEQAIGVRRHNGA